MLVVLPVIKSGPSLSNWYSSVLLKRCLDSKGRMMVRGRSRKGLREPKVVLPNEVKFGDASVSVMVRLTLI